MGDTQVDAENIMRILVATDNHLGFCEKDAIRGDDSFITFEEILEKAVELDVDFVLLGGDLFHEAVPSQNSLHKCMTLLRQYTFGDRAISIECLGDQNTTFHNAVNHCVNYEDPNLNVSIPVFSIHGNHDDPSGFGRLSSLDLLSTSGLVNYFGRWTDLTKVDIKPLLLRKGETQLAMYGLSHIHDARLARLFEDFKVNFNCPASEEEQEWFHLMVLHQNRAMRGVKNYLPEEVLPEILNLVIWGHEHDCRIEPEYNHKREFFVSQPGSSVATSLAEGEALEKKVALLEIHKTKFRLEPVSLKTVRPLIFESVDVTDMTDELYLDAGDASRKIQDWAADRVGAMIQRAETMRSGHPKQPKLPLIRLRLIYSSEEQMFNHIRFGQAFNDKVANPADIVIFKKAKKVGVKNEDAGIDRAAMSAAFENMEIDVNTRMEELVDRYFETVDQQKGLQLMPTKALSEMLFRLVERNDDNAAESIIGEKALNHLMDTLPNEETIDEQLATLKGNITHDEVLTMLDNRGATNNSNAATTSARGRKTTTVTTSNSRAAKTFRDEDVGKSSTATTTTTTTKTRGRGRGSRGGATAASPSKRGGSTRGGHVMPQLDISVGASRATRQTTLLNTITQSTKTRATRKPKVIELSDSD